MNQDRKSNYNIKLNKKRKNIREKFITQQSINNSNYYQNIIKMQNQNKGQQKQEKNKTTKSVKKSLHNIYNYSQEYIQSNHQKCQSQQKAKQYKNRNNDNPYYKPLINISQSSNYKNKKKQSKDKNINSLFNIPIQDNCLNLAQQLIQKNLHTEQLANPTSNNQNGNTKITNSLVSMKEFLNSQSKPNYRYHQQLNRNNQSQNYKQSRRYFSVQKQSINRKQNMNNTPQPKRNQLIIQNKINNKSSNDVILTKQKLRFQTETSQKLQKQDTNNKSNQNSQKNVNYQSNLFLINPKQGVFGKIRKNLQMKRKLIRNYQNSKVNLIKRIQQCKSNLSDSSFDGELKQRIHEDFKFNDYQELLFHFYRFQSIYKFLKFRTEQLNKNIQGKKLKCKNKIQMDQMFRQRRKTGIQLINQIKQYILQDYDACCLQNAIKGNKTKKAIKKILYYQRAVIILMVQYLITGKFHMHQTHFNCIMQLLHNQFYMKAFQILIQFSSKIEQKIIQLQQKSIDKQKISETVFIEHKFKQTVYKQSKKLLSITKAKKYQQPQQKAYFRKLLKNLQSKLQFILRHSQIAKYLKHQQKQIHSSTSNFLYYNLLEYFSFYLLDKDCLGWNIQFLQTCPSPYLHKDSQKKWTLVLDMDQTLIHYKISQSGTGQFLIRPHLNQFLKTLSNFFQIGIFTCSLPQYADLILDHLSNIQFRLYRHHCIKVNGQYVKDLSRIGRNLKKTIIVDNLDKNFQLQKRNGIHIKSWYGDKKDKTLKLLMQHLSSIITKNPDDIRAFSMERNFL